METADRLFGAVAVGLAGCERFSSGGCREIQSKQGVLGNRLMTLRDGGIELLLSDGGHSYGSVTGRPTKSGWVFEATGFPIPPEAVRSAASFVAYARCMLGSA